MPYSEAASAQTCSEGAAAAIQCQAVTQRAMRSRCMFPLGPKQVPATARSSPMRAPPCASFAVAESTAAAFSRLHSTQTSRDAVGPHASQQLVFLQEVAVLWMISMEPLCIFNLQNVPRYALGIEAESHIVVQSGTARYSQQHLMPTYWATHAGMTHPG